MEPATKDLVVNRIPPSTAKRRPSCSGSERNRKRQKSAAEEDAFLKLNPSDPVHAKRLEQRRKAVTKGKNTAGYDAYIQQVPKHKRRARSMETPSTPDASLDIPKKRWEGMMKAWRIALHKYDPPDLLKAAEDSASKTTTIASPFVANTVSPAAFSTPTPSSRATEEKSSARRNLLSSPVCAMEDSPISVMSDRSAKRSLGDEFAGPDDDDSDDDLL